jgi:hypothetical protein
MTCHAAQTGSRGIAVLLNLGTRWGTGGHCLTLGMVRMGGPHGWSEQVVEEKSCYSHLGLKPKLFILQ